MLTLFGNLWANMNAWWAGITPTEAKLLALGFGAQTLFFLRFVFQWIASERAKNSVVPEIFWYFSLVGGVGLFAYATLRGDPVIMVGQATGLLIYSRNLYFIWRIKLIQARQPLKMPAE